MERGGLECGVLAPRAGKSSGCCRGCGPLPTPRAKDKSSQGTGRKLSASAGFWEGEWWGRGQGAERGTTEQP